MTRTLPRALVTAALAVSLFALQAGCAGKKKSAGQTLLTAQATYDQAIARLSQHDLRQARALLERIQYDRTTRQSLEPLARLALADATFYQGTDLAWIDARSLYLDFVTLYGSHELAPYSQLQAGQCSLLQVNHPSRDQTQTLQAIADLAQVERRWPQSNYVRASRDLMRSARSNLAEHEFLVGRFYLKKKQYGAAVERFRSVVNEYPDFPEKEKILFHLGRALMLGDNDVEGRIYLTQLMSEFPEGDYVEQARKALGQAPPEMRAGIDGLQ